MTSRLKLWTLMCAVGGLTTMGCSADVSDPQPVGTVAQALEPTPDAVTNGLYRLHTFWTGGCVTVNGASEANGANIISPDECGGGDNAIWEFRAMARGDYRLRAQHSGKCMRAKGDVETGNVQQGRCIYLRSRWGVAPWTGGNPEFVQLISTKTGACAQLEPNNTNLTQQVCAESDEDENFWGQMFRMEEVTPDPGTG
jgi:hypothetical protein